MKDWYDPCHDLENLTAGGFHVIGKNTANGEISIWRFDKREYADHFAENLAKDTLFSVLVVELLTVFRPEIPVIKRDMQVAKPDTP